MHMLAASEGSRTCKFRPTAGRSTSDSIPIEDRCDASPMPESITISRKSANSTRPRRNLCYERICGVLTAPADNITSFVALRE